MAAAVSSMQFVHSYSKLLVQAWTDPAFKELLESNPVAALKTENIVVQPGASVEVIAQSAGKPDLQAQIQAWEEGEKSNKYVLYVPDKPQLGVTEGTAGVNAAMDTSYCCCCCPCCTCT